MFDFFQHLLSLKIQQSKKQRLIRPVRVELALFFRCLTTQLIIEGNAKTKRYQLLFIILFLPLNYTSWIFLPNVTYLFPSIPRQEQCQQTNQRKEACQQHYISHAVCVCQVADHNGA